MVSSSGYTGNGKHGTENGNGHSNGGNGGGIGRGVRSACVHIRKLAEAGALATDEIPKAIAMAQAIASSAEATNRDRMAALKLIAAFAKLGFDADVQDDKMDRLDNGKATENQAVQVRYGEDGARRWSL